LIHIGQEGLATEAVTILNCSLKVTAILNEDQLLLLFQYVQFSIRTKVNLHGPGSLKVIRVVMGGRKRKHVVGNMR
jgi:hypothetical protein